MANIFLSYAREDREAAERLARALEARGWSVWWDPEILPGESWDEVIERELNDSRCVLVLWSRTSVRKHWVKVEAEEGRKRRILLPVLIDDCSPPLAFRAIQAAPLFDWAGEEAHRGFVRLCSAISRKIGASAFEPKNGVDVDPRDLPDLAVFKDTDATWCPELVIIPAGSFLMGSPPDEAERRDVEDPQHQVTFEKRLALGRHAVTVGEYRRFVAATGHDHNGGMYIWTGGEWKQDPRKNWEHPGFAQDERHPVVGVSWRDATAYVDWLSGELREVYRLPTEAEWEYACRADTATPFSFGATISPDQANYDGNYAYGKGGKGQFREKTVAVGSLPANPWGLHEMHGNVWEWIEDIWHDKHAGAPVDGSAWTDGEGKISNRNRVVRGGSWFNYPRLCRSAYRYWLGPAIRHVSLGFRLARTLS